MKLVPEALRRADLRVSATSPRSMPNSVVEGSALPREEKLRPAAKVATGARPNHLRAACMISRASDVAPENPAVYLRSGGVERRPFEVEYGHRGRAIPAPRRRRLDRLPAPARSSRRTQTRRVSRPKPGRGGASASCAGLLEPMEQASATATMFFFGFKASAGACRRPMIRDLRRVAVHSVHGGEVRRIRLQRPDMQL